MCRDRTVGCWRNNNAWDRASSKPKLPIPAALPLARKEKGRGLCDNMILKHVRR